jgi:threonylcarbamoyladenosine tRNA methylthiotransferase MtaB
MCITDELLEVMATCSLIGRHLHIPLQSGDDKVLKSMGRQYDRAFFAEKVAAAREAIPGLNLTTDVIVGFPTEDEAAFANTINFVSKIGFSKVHVFPYSPRPGTKAAAWGNPVSAAEKKRRSLLMRQLSDRLGLAYRQRKVGRVSEVLLESQVRPGVYRGYSSDYTRFLVENGEVGKMVRVRAEVVRGKEIWGRLVRRQTPAAAGT